MRHIPFAFFLLVFNTLFGAFTTVEDKADLTILTPSLAQRKCVKLRLDNGLEAYLLSDPNAHESGASLTVDVGSLSDPSQHPGMAHFCEHMLFLGTEKYPDEKEYHRYLDEFGGNRNACTCTDRTLYMFSVNHEGFVGALSRFSEFFISPLFNASCAERERSAVDSEFTKNLSQDMWRIHHVQKEIANKEHPFHRFCIGNGSTLASVSTDELKTWYENHYSANLMHLVVISPLPMNELISLVDQTFSRVKNKNLTRQTCQQPLFSESTQKELLVIEPRLNVSKLELSFELPPEILQATQIRADRLLSYALGHEGKSSLLALLKKEKLATGLSTDVSRIVGSQSIFTVSIDLTTQGVKEYQKVMDLCFGALKNYGASGLPQYLFDEMCQMEKINFSYQEPSDIFEYVTELGLCISDEPLETFPKLTVCPSSYDAESTKALATTLGTCPACLTLIAPRELTQLTLDHKEKWMGSAYTLLPLEKSHQLSQAIGIPRQNPFIPQDLSLLPKANKPQEEKVIPSAHLLFENKKAKVYFAKDDRYLVPEVYMAFHFKTPLIANDDGRSKVLADLLCLSIKERLAEISYEAKLAGLSYSLAPTDNGIELTLNGYSPKASVLLFEIVDATLTFKPTLEEFNLYQEELSHQYHNLAEKSPLAIAQEELLTVLYKDYVGPTLKEQLIEKVSFEQFVSFSAQVFKQNYLEATLWGNLEEETAKTIVETLQNKLPAEAYSSEKHFKLKLADLSEANSPFYFSKKCQLPENALILALDASSFSFKKQAALDLLAKGMEEPFFSELRTRQQTAYLLRNSSREIERTSYLFFLIQSSTHEPRDLLARFELFIESSLRTFKAIDFTPERFALLQEALVQNLRHSWETQSDAGAALHTLAFKYEGRFDWYDEKIKALQELTYEEFQEIVFEALGKQNKKRVAICIQGKTDARVLSYRKMGSLKTIRKQISYKPKQDNVCAYHSFSSAP